MRSLEMRKKRRLRSVCAPHRRSAGTSIGPKLSFSVRLPLIAALMLLLQRLLSAREVENQHLGGLASLEGDLAGVGLERIARLQALAIDEHRAARHVHVADPALRQRERRVLGAVEQTGVHAGVLMDGHRALRAA